MHRNGESSNQACARVVHKYENGKTVDVKERYWGHGQEPFGGDRDELQDWRLQESSKQRDRREHGATSATRTIPGLFHVSKFRWILVLPPALLLVHGLWSECNQQRQPPEAFLGISHFPKGCSR